MGRYTFRGKTYNIPRLSGKALRREAQRLAREESIERAKSKSRERRSRSTGSVKRIQDIKGFENGINNATKRDEALTKQAQARKARSSTVEKILKEDAQAAAIDRQVKAEEARKEIIVAKSSQEALTQRRNIINQRRNRVITDPRLNQLTIEQERQIREDNIAARNQRLKSQVESGELTPSQAIEESNRFLEVQKEDFLASQNFKNERARQQDIQIFSEQFQSRPNESAQQERFNVYSFNRKTQTAALGKEIGDEQLLKDFQRKERDRFEGTTLGKPFKGLRLADEKVSNLISSTSLVDPKKVADRILLGSRNLQNRAIKQGSESPKLKQSLLEPDKKNPKYVAPSTLAFASATSGGVLKNFAEKPVTNAALFAVGAGLGAAAGFVKTGAIAAAPAKAEVFRNVFNVGKVSAVGLGVAGVTLEGIKLSKIKDPVKRGETLGLDAGKAISLGVGAKVGFNKLTTPTTKITPLKKSISQPSLSRPRTTTVVKDDGTIITQTTKAYSKTTKFPLREPSKIKFTEGKVVTKVKPIDGGYRGFTTEKNPFFQRQTVFTASKAGKGDFITRTATSIQGKKVVVQNQGFFSTSKTKLNPNRIEFTAKGEDTVIAKGGFTRESLVFKGNKLQLPKASDKALILKQDAGNLFTTYERGNLLNKKQRFFFSKDLQVATKQNVGLLKTTARSGGQLYYDGSTVKIPKQREIATILKTTTSKKITTAAKTTVGIKKLKPMSASKKGQLTLSKPLTVQRTPSKLNVGNLQGSSNIITQFQPSFASSFTGAGAGRFYPIFLGGFTRGSLSVKNVSALNIGTKNLAITRTALKLQPATSTALRLTPAQTTSSKTGLTPTNPLTPPSFTTTTPIVPVVPIPFLPRGSGVAGFGTSAGRRKRKFKLTRTGLQASVSELRKKTGSKLSRKTGIGFR